MRRKMLRLVGGVTLVGGLTLTTVATAAPAHASNPCGELGAALIYHIEKGNLAYASQLYDWAIQAGCGR